MNGGGYLGCEPVRRWLQSDQFLDEPVYCEATHDPDDVLYVGSDDDEYSNPTERQERIEAKAQRFLAGKPISIFSASLQGPFTRKSGWVNPWRSKSAVRKSVRRKPPPRKRLPGDLKKIALNYDGYVRSDDVSTPQSNVAHVEDVPTQEMTDDEDDTFVRIRDWRERVLSEIHVNVSPARTQPTQTEPFSTHPKSAVIEDLQRDAESTPQQSQREPALLPEDTTDPSPHALRIYEESVWNKSLRLPDDETLDQTPLPESSLERGAHVPGSSEERTPQDTTQNVAPITISDKVLASTQEDGSFLFRRARKEAPGPRLRRGRSSKLAPDMGDATEDQMQDRVSGPGTPQQHMSATEEENETTETPAPELAPGSYEPSQDEALPEQKEASSPVTTQEATAQDIQQKSPAPIPSQVDETTLVAPESSSSSEHLSLGNFSCERGSQDITSTVLGFPKRLLWPKAESSNEGRASEPNFGLDSTRPIADKAADGLRAIQNALEQPSTCRSPVAPSPKEMIVAQASQGLKDLQDALERPSPDKLADSIVVGGELAGSETASESEIEDEIVVNTQDRPGEQVGEENEIVVSTQHNPVDDDVQEKEEPPHEAAAMECDAPEPEASPLEPPPAVQSPWATDTRPFPPNTDTRSPLVNRATAAVASETSQSQDVQSPWARGDSQLAAVSIPAPEIRSFVPFSSPANSAVLPILRPETPPPQSQAEVLAEGSNEPQSSIAQLSTPDSSQPTPESNLKSFRDFMTPSPPAAKRRRIISTDTDGRLPSTQLFVDAAVSNPWSASHLHSSATRFPSSLPKSTTAASGKRKRVSFAPLPGDPNFFVGSSPSSSGIISTPVISKPNHRAASPPPPPSSALSETTNSSTAETKFQKHFTRMVSRSRYSMGSVTSTSRTPSTGSRTPIMNLLPTESQQTCASPAVDAMAEAFLAADHPVGHSDPAGEREDKSPSGSSFASGGVDGEMEMDMSPVMAKGLSLGGETQEEDDVTEVLSNLDDFLGGNLLDLETETPLGREENQRRSLGAGSFGFGGFEDVEANVWDQP
ncbi:hypothetical protein QBC35DRAFT_432082 [Podospora australis]|uniref:Protamine P1 n=1 Tax=Podospora australis TaxID=1536484 RepID=A0AAN6WV86_9PEZI|nr:hypothetical protein QBC35DRAFT_432082 [Podospora australis]